MEKGELITVLVAIGAILAMVLLAFSNTLSTTGYISAKGAEAVQKTVQLQLFVNGDTAPGEIVAAQDTGVALNAQRSGGPLQSVEFTAEHESGCTVSISTDAKEPYEATWKPYATAEACGYGTYTLRAIGTHASGALITAKQVTALAPATPPFSLEMLNPDNGDWVQPQNTIAVQVDGPVSRVEFYADSVYTHNGARVPSLLQAVQTADDGDEGEYDYKWDALADPYDVTGGDSSYEYNPYGTRVVEVRAIAENGDVVSQRTTVTVVELPPS